MARMVTARWCARHRQLCPTATSGENRADVNSQIHLDMNPNHCKITLPSRGRIVLNQYSTHMHRFPCREEGGTSGRTVGRKGCDEQRPAARAQCNNATQNAQKRHLDQTHTTHQIGTRWGPLRHNTLTTRQASERSGGGGPEAHRAPPQTYPPIAHLRGCRALDDLPPQRGGHSGRPPAAAAQQEASEEPCLRQVLRRSSRCKPTVAAAATLRCGRRAQPLQQEDLLQPRFSRGAAPCDAKSLFLLRFLATVVALLQSEAGTVPKAQARETRADQTPPQR